MGQKLLLLPDELLKSRETHFAKDDFDWYLSPHRWTTTVSDLGTVAIDADGVGGIVVLTPSDGTVGDNDEAYLATTNEVLKLAAGKAVMAESILKFEEANTNDANVCFCMADAIGANTLVDNGAGMKTSFSGAAIFKVDGGTVWKCITSLSTTQTISTSTKTAGGSSYQRLTIEVLPVEVGGSTAKAAFYVDGQPLIDSTTLKPIVHTFTITSATEMQVGCGVKNGDTNLETLNVDLMSWAQTR